MRFLSPEEVVRLADAISPQYRGYVLLGAYGGLRIGEMAAFRTGRFDALSGIVDVAETYDEESGIGNRKQTRGDGASRLTLALRKRSRLASALDPTWTAI